MAAMRTRHIQLSRALLLGALGVACASRSKVLDEHTLAEEVKPAKEKGGRANVEAYDVHLLVTRHGLSCTNVAQTWISRYDIGRSNIHDPLLAGAGKSGTVPARSAVAAWLEERNMTLDGVVSSVLARAMETAILTYPQVSTVSVAPYIREQSRGLSNAPKEPKEQVVDLTNALTGVDFKLDYRWINVFGGDEASWSDFLKFLEQSFLPAFISARGKPPGSKIVLAVVTHSNFMRDSRMGEKCKQFWTSRGEKKPLNNQVLHVPYSFTVEMAGPERIDVTTTYTLKERGSFCEEVFGGVSSKDAKGKIREPLCLSDIGDDCHTVINKYSTWPGTLYGKTYENRIFEIADEVAQREQGRNQSIDEMSRLMEQLSHMHKHGPIRETSWGFTTEVTVADVEQGIESLKLDIRRFDNYVSWGRNRIAELMGVECWSGGTPDPWKHLSIQANGKHHPRAVQIIREVGKVD